jgi:hypothetical protein
MVVLTGAEDDGAGRDSRSTPRRRASLAALASSAAGRRPVGAQGGFGSGAQQATRAGAACGLPFYGARGGRSPAWHARQGQGPSGGAAPARLLSQMGLAGPGGLAAGPGRSGYGRVEPTGSAR